MNPSLIDRAAASFVTACELLDFERAERMWRLILLLEEEREADQSR